MRSKIILLSIILSLKVLGRDTEKKDSLSLIFIGDIMGHSPQIQSAFDPKTGEYDYEGVFEKVSPIIKSANFAIANLEVTLSGEPYEGYPRFSSPDALAVACKNNGINVLVTANNHSCDRGKEGIVRTINVLDSLGIRHTGTFKNPKDREENNLLILNENNIKVGLLNYTYGTNGLTIPAPTLVNLSDTLTMLSDIQKSRSSFLDKLIVVIHWGNEYQSCPSASQIKIAKFLFGNGVDIIVGSHPHVLQKMGHTPDGEGIGGRLIAYSLGNFISNQRTRKRDGGAMLKLTLTKEGNDVKISNPGYYLTWVHKTIINGKTSYEVIPCSIAETNNFDGMGPVSKKNIGLFISDSRALLGEGNINIDEIKQ